jgi:hypothetical protein
MTYKMSLSMAEKLIFNQQQAQLAQHAIPSQPATPLVTNKSGSSISSNSKTPPHELTTTNNVESISKKIIGGIKLPFLNFNNSSSSAPQNAEKSANHGSNNQAENSSNTNNQSAAAAANTSNNPDDTKDFVVPQRIDLASNSKSKRPISTQLFDSSATAHTGMNT